MKPSYEAIIVARKPCEGSCIDNVIKYGVGGINIDECRIGTDVITTNGARKNPMAGDERTGKALGMFQETKALNIDHMGRFPSNLILTYDETDFEEVCGGMPIDSGYKPHAVYSNIDKYEGYGSITKKQGEVVGYGDAGSAARYFYNAQVTDRDQEQIIYEVTNMENQENQSIHLYSEGKSYKLYQGNMLDMLDVIEPNSIDAIVTDPPYELNFMNKNWDNSGIAFQKETWEKCLKVLKPGGYLIAFGGSRTHHRIMCAIEDAGFEIRDMICWIFGSGFPKSMNIGLAIDQKNGVESSVVGAADFPDIRSGNYENNDDTRIMHPIVQPSNAWTGWGTQLKPAYESITVARKPCDGSITDNVMKYGVGGINIDECRVPTDDVLTHGGNLGVNSGDTRTGKALGMFQEGTLNTFEQNPNGRFPANVILTYDDTDYEEVCGGMPYTKSTGGSGEASKINTFSNTYNGGWGHDKNCANLGGLGDEGSAARYFYCAKASKRDRDEGLDAVNINHYELLPDVPDEIVSKILQSLTSQC